MSERQLTSRFWLNLILIVVVGIAAYFIYQWFVNRKNPLEATTGYTSPANSAMPISQMTAGQKYTTVKDINDMLTKQVVNSFNPVTGIASAAQTLGYFAGVKW